MSKLRFEIDIQTNNKNEMLYCIDSDVYMWYQQEVFSFGKILYKYEHPWVGTFYLDVRNEIVYQAITTYQEYQTN